MCPICNKYCYTKLLEETIKINLTLFGGQVTELLITIVVDLELFSNVPFNLFSSLSGIIDQPT